MIYDTVLIILALLIAIPFIYYMVKDNNIEYNELKRKRGNGGHAAS